MPDCCFRFTEGNLQPRTAIPSDREIWIHDSGLFNQGRTRLQVPNYSGKYPSTQTERDSVILGLLYGAVSESFCFGDLFRLIGQPTAHFTLCITSRSKCICQDKTRVDFDRAGKQ